MMVFTAQLCVHTPPLVLQFDEATLIAANRLESQLHKVKQTIEDDKQTGMATPYALVIDGRALLYALSPRLRQLFLEVSLHAQLLYVGARPQLDRGCLCRRAGGVTGCRRVQPLPERAVTAC